MSLRKFSIVEEQFDIDHLGGRKKLILVGRDYEVNNLVRQALALKEKTKGSAVFIEGKAGIGKSALLVDFTEILVMSVDHSRVVKVGTEELHAKSALSIWGSVFEQLFEHNL